MNNNLAPIALFVYNRLEKTKQTISYLLKNQESKDSILYIYSDGPKNIKEKNIIYKVRKFLNTITGFKKIKIIKRDANLGLSKSIILGVTEILKFSENIIVLEDDMLTSPYFLKFMNDGLILYQNENKVASIHGYTYPIPENLPNTFFIRGADCWGWATWKRGWKLFNPNANILLEKLSLDEELKKMFNFNNTYNYIAMLEKQITGEIDSWAIRWYASCFLKNKLTLYPGKSLITNIGLDGEGTHCSSTDDYNTLLYKHKLEIQNIAIKESLIARKYFENYFKSITNKSNKNKTKNDFVSKLKNYIFKKL